MFITSVYACVCACVRNHIGYSWEGTEKEAAEADLEADICVLLSSSTRYTLHPVSRSFE